MKIVNETSYVVRNKKRVILRVEQYGTRAVVARADDGTLYRADMTNNDTWGPWYRAVLVPA